jgi:hypothetical protein
VKTYSELTIEMSKSDRDELRSRLVIVMEHLLKCDHPRRLLSHNERLWRGTIRRERRDILTLLKKHPGLKVDVNQEFVDKTYTDALAEVTAEFPATTFPRSSPYTLEQVVGDEVMNMLER